MNNPTGDGQSEIFGPYEIYEQLGVGGMATVHRAKKQGIEGFQRVVALKRLLSHLADDESFVKSFVREARLASYLQHANIIQIYDLGLVNGIYFIAMEFVRGRDLRKLLKQTAYATGPMPVPMMLALTRQMCDALDYAHSRTDENGEPLGIVHRDISPSNLLVSADGHLKIIDFGIAKATTASLRTHSGRVKGKFAYMAPESIRGKPLDHRSDIFAAGIVAHEMLTARPLFASKNEYDTLRKITQLPVEPPSRYNPDCPADLDDIVLTALSRSPEERWQSAGAMLRALDHVAKKLALQATNRDVAEWVEWAFAQPLQSERVAHQALSQPAQNLEQGKKPHLMSSTGPPSIEAIDQVSIEMVWGNQALAETTAVPRTSSSAHSTLYGLAPPPVAAPRQQPAGAGPDRQDAATDRESARMRHQTPLISADPGADPVLANDTLLDDGTSFAALHAEPRPSFAAPEATATIDALSSRGSLAPPKGQPKPQVRPKRSGLRTALWLMFFAVLFAGAVVGGYYLVPGEFLGSSNDHTEPAGNQASPDNPSPADTPGEK